MDEETTPPPLPFRTELSRNQKKRSRLQQSTPPPPPPEPAPKPEPAPEAKPPPIVRKFRLKRSGQMHDDLKSPFPDDNAPLRAPEY